MWFQRGEGEGDEHGEGQHREEGTHGQVAVARQAVQAPAHEALSTRKTSTTSSNSSGSGEEDGGEAVEGRLRCDHALLQRMLVHRSLRHAASRQAPPEKDASHPVPAAAQPTPLLGGDGWHVRVLVDAHAAQGASLASAAGQLTSDLGEASVRRVEVRWEAPTSLPACRRLAASLSAALVDTCSLDLVGLLTPCHKALLASSDVGLAPTESLRAFRLPRAPI